MLNTPKNPAQPFLAGRKIDKELHETWMLWFVSSKSKRFEMCVELEIFVQICIFANCFSIIFSIMFDCTIKFDFQSEGDTIRIYSFDQFRPLESAAFPNIIDITQAST